MNKLKKIKLEDPCVILVLIFTLFKEKIMFQSLNKIRIKS